MPPPPPPPRPPRPPRAPITFHDLYSIAFAAARIAHRAAHLQATASASASGEAASASRVATATTRQSPTWQPSTSTSTLQASPQPPPPVKKPWPTQRVRQQQPTPAGRDSTAAAAPATGSLDPDKFSLPPQAPDGTFTEMKHVNKRDNDGGGVDDAQPPPPLSSEERDEVTRKLDQSMAAYFADAGADADADSGTTATATTRPAADAHVDPQPASTPPTPPTSGAQQMHESPRTSTSESQAVGATPLTQQAAPAAAAATAEDVEGPASLASSPSSLSSSPSPLLSSSASPPTASSPPPPPPPPPPDALDDLPEYDATSQPHATAMRASKVPSSRIARLMHYGTLGAGLAWGAAGSFLSGGGAPSQVQPDSADGSSSPAPRKAPNAFMSDANVRRLVDKLSRMRGAALKLGQFLSIQDSNLLPPEIERVLQQVQNSANYMPAWQMERVMREDLGADWRQRFASFNDVPFAAASIGQVHHGVLAADHATHPSMAVAVKIQFPGIRESIESDLGYLRWLLNASALLPRGLFLESTIKQMRMELQDECDYAREAEMGARFARIFNRGEGQGGAQHRRFEVPEPVRDLCAPRVLTTQMMKGRPLSHVEGYSEERRNQIATSLLHLALSELFTHRLMQTDPNFSNFLYSPPTRRVQLIDFGATREYTRAFMDDWLRLLLCAVNEDVAGCRRWSEKVGYLLGTESDEMVAAHVASMTLLGSPFRSDAPYDFTYQTLTDEIKSHIPVMLAQRKTPPPKETYSLNRKLSGTFLICSKLRATVDCRQVLRDVVEGYEFENGGRVAVGGDGRLQVRGGGTEAASAQTPTRTKTHTTSSTPSQAPSQAPPSTTYRGLHTSSRILRQVDELEQSSDRRQDSSGATPASLGDAIRTVKTAGKATRQQRKVRERYGINLGDRWPRALQAQARSVGDDKAPPAPSSEFDTLAQSPAGTSMSTPAPTTGGDPATSSPLRREATPAEQPSPAETPFGAAEDSSKDRVAGPPPPAAPTRTIRGVKLPSKPSPPGSEDCCMSGCARCVYDLYKEDLEEYQEVLGSVRRQLLALGVGRDEWDEGVLGRMPDDGDASDASSASSAADAEVDAVIAGLDPSMKAFLEMERRMKRKAKEREAGRR